MSGDAYRRVMGELVERAGLAAVPRATLMVAAAVCAVALLLWGVSACRDEGATFAVEDASSTSGLSADTQQSDPDTGSAAPILVHVAGSVGRPGVVELPAGSRVYDAVRAAGGELGSAVVSSVNLARVLADGEQIYIPSHDELEAQGGVGAGAVAPPGSAQGDSATPRVNLNTATAAELDLLPGVGPSTAAKIVADREANGPFARVEDLMRVSGIGEKKFAALEDLVSVK